MARPPRLLGELVGDVAGIEIGKDQHVGTARDVTRVRHFPRRDRGG